MWEAASSGGAVPRRRLKGPRPASGGWTPYITRVVGWRSRCGACC